MAKKRFLFFCCLKSALTRRVRLVALAMLGLLLSLSIHALGPGEALAFEGRYETSPEPVAALLEQGKTNYNAGRFWEAAQLYERVVRQYETEGYILNQALALSHLSLAYQQLGELQKASEAIARSFSLLELRSDADMREQSRVRARVWNARGSLLLATQKPEEALRAWEEAEGSYRQAGEIFGILGSQINQTQAMKNLGLYRQADKLLAKIREDLLDIPDNTSEKYGSLKVAALHHLGNLLQQKGQLDEARSILEESLQLANQWHLRREASAIFISMGNAARAQRAKLKASGYRARRQGDEKRADNLEQKAEKATEEALYLYKNAAIEKHASPQTLVQARLNYLSLLVETGSQGREAETLWRSIRNELEDLPLGRDAVYARVNLAKSLVCLREQNPNCLRQEERIDSLLSAKTLERSSWLGDAIALFESAAKEARKLEDRRAESYAIGNLGRLYEEMGEWENALRYSQQALSLAGGFWGRDIAYQWQWQLGRLLNRQNDTEGAMAAYLQAVQSLNTLRGDLTGLNRDLNLDFREVQLDFRDEVEPVYRQSLDLLLQPDPGTSQPSQEHLRQARDVFEALQVLEIDNYFIDGCSPIRSGDIDEIADAYDPTAAIVHAFLLKYRLAVILKLPGQEGLEYYESRHSVEDVRDILKQLTNYLRATPSYAPEAIQISRKLYTWLNLESVERAIEDNHQVETVAFVLDRLLQNIPIATLYDGHKYLLERQYDLAIVPAIKMLYTPKFVTKLNNYRVFRGGVGKAQTIQGIAFQEIRRLDEEMDAIGELFPANPPLVNEDFTVANLEKQLASERFSIVHIKTHGQFSSDPEETFIVAYQELITSKGLDGLVQSVGEERINTIELLVLSSCETALGDDRASLGLAGVAVRAGARSTLSTLWVARDAPTTQLMLRFYQELSKPNTTKARALHNAQQQVLRQYQLPYFWAPYVLVGNWR